MTWARAKNEGRSGNASFKLGDPAVAEAATYWNLFPLQRALVLEWDDVVVYAGIIDDVDYDFDSKTLDLVHKDLWSVWPFRYALAVHGAGAQSTKLVYNNLTLATLAKRAVFEGQNSLPSSQYQLPIVYPADATGTHDETWYGYHFKKVSDILDEIIKTEGGPDIDFAPRWAADGSLEWVMRTGDLSGATWEWDLSQLRPEVKGAKLKISADDMVTRVIGTGEGSEKKVLTASAEATDSTIIGRERVTSFQGEASLTRLQARTRADLEATRVSVQQPGFSVRADGVVPVSALQLGGTVWWHVQDDPYIPFGWKDEELIEFSGDLSNRVKLSLQRKGSF
ncbi:hypothetical protein [Arthrobacter sp. R-11]|uniref:hypothetical protein n=1 Tax=Arthrobacter sp. R-11 TaxID=3404053 RepID=UPI003CEF1AE3